MGRRRHSYEEKSVELDLAPIMNIVMILIPLLLLSAVFLKTGVVNISSPRNAQAQQADTEERPEEVPVPRVYVTISADGFRVGDQRNLPEFARFQAPIARCGGTGAGAAVAAPHDAASAPPTICLREGADPNAPLVDKLDYPALYNHLVQVRMQPQWFDGFGKENASVISILGDPEIEFEVLIRTMDTARHFLQPAETALAAPSASASIDAYLLGGGNPTLEHLMAAEYLKVDGALVPLFPDPVLLLPRPSAGG